MFRVLDALPSARPVESQPPPGLAGIIILMAGADCAHTGNVPAAAIAASDLSEGIATHGVSC